MRWFKHFADARHNSKVRRIEKHFGPEGYACAFKLLELLASHGGSGEDFKPEIRLSGGHRDKEWLAFELGIPRKDLGRMLRLFAEVDFIDAAAWRKGVIVVPAMRMYVDEFTRKRKARPNSGLSPDRSGLTPEQSPPEAEADTEAEQAEAEQETQAPPTPQGGRACGACVPMSATT